jgi:hypothetical protein
MPMKPTRTRTITIRVEPKLYEKAYEEAYGKYHRTVSSFIHCLLLDYFKKDSEPPNLNKRKLS